MTAALAALMDQTPVAIAVDKEIATPAYYNEADFTIYINPAHTDTEIFKALATEIAFARAHDRGYNKGYRREAAQAIFSRCTTDGFSFDFEVLMRADRLGLKVEQIPVSVINFRESKVNVIRDSARMFRDVFRIRKKVRSGK